MITPHIKKIIRHYGTWNIEYIMAAYGIAVQDNDHPLTHTKKKNASYGNAADGI